MLKKILINSATVFVASIICFSFLHLGYYRNYTDLIKFSILLAFVNMFIRPIIKIVSLPITVLTLGIFSLVVNVLIVIFCSHFVHGIHMQGFIAASILAVIIAICHPVIEMGSFIVENVLG